MDVFSGLIILILGYVAGLITNGVKITINHNRERETSNPNVEEGYNESTEDFLPDEVRDYAEKNKGFHNF